MKKYGKKYVKPALYFESFELTQFIAACETDVGATDKACVASHYNMDPAFFDDEGNFFWDGNNYCWTNHSDLSGEFVMAFNS